MSDKINFFDKYFILCFLWELLHKNEVVRDFLGIEDNDNGSER